MGSVNDNNNKTIYIGIDPGITGAVAIIFSDGTPPIIFDMPLTADKKIDSIMFFAKLRQITHGKSVFCFIEKSQAMPKQGVVSVFTYGMSYGKILASLAIANISFQEIPSQSWKKEFSLIKKEKEESVVVASQIFPDIATQLTRSYQNKGETKTKFLHGRADALLIAEYAKRRMTK